ncbi:MAG: sensor domain-containing diguanylate cyclase [Pseudomonadota bacterium]|jgi:diguanylate cyclase (GGDEF)-like protein|nr:sensor domain-containing diguanylate cyclase [Pseudomonadota bacterium]
MTTDATEARYAALLQVCQDPLLVLDGERIVEAVPGSADWVKPEEMRGKELADFLAEDLLLQIRPLIERARQEGAAQHEYQLRPEHLPGLRALGLHEVIWYRGRWVATGGGEVIWSARDITAEKNLERRQSHQTQRDPLTGAYNRRALLPVLEVSIAQALRYDGTSSILLLDIDDFSRINEQFGWDTGDQVLRQTVSELHRLKRTSDFVARYADDQLVMVLPETNHEQALLAGERMRSAIEALVLPHPQGNLSWTVSVGAASALRLEDDAASLLRRAHEHLLIAQHSGANRVEGEAL